MCWGCDARAHAAKKLAGKHLRYLLLSGDRCGDGSAAYGPSSSSFREASGYFFCSEDRAVLCWNCSVAVRSAIPYVSAHQRFLLMWVQAGVEAIEPVDLINNRQSNASRGAKGEHDSIKVFADPHFLGGNRAIN
ncbi:B-box zinc finger [Musa troglodytarum]|uniref:B-box zinc finger n=1 Tax=Musa troglodytarum TaxID=320322 RepID=A0A9E7KYQ6_9LILI|nr:B-box zinc finger [Musa troglodytarum]